MNVYYKGSFLDWLTLWSLGSQQWLSSRWRAENLVVAQSMQVPQLAQTGNQDVE